MVRSVSGHVKNSFRQERIGHQQLEVGHGILKTPAFNVSCLCAPGTIKEITGIVEVKAFPEVEDVVIAHAPGESITEQMRGLLAQITVRVLGSVYKKEDLLPLMQCIDKNVHIIGENGEDLLLPGIEPDDVEGYVL